MRKRRPEQVWKNVLTLLALAAALAALYLQLFERGARQEEARLAAVRLDDALAESRARLRAEILADLRAELAEEEESPVQSGKEPLPDRVLRRLEASGAGALEQALGPASSREALLLARVNAGLADLARQTEEADRALRRDLEELRAATLRETDVARKVTTLALVALLCLVGRALPDRWPRREAAPEEAASDRPAATGSCTP